MSLMQTTTSKGDKKDHLSPLILCALIFAIGTIISVAVYVAVGNGKAALSLWIVIAAYNIVGLIKNTLMNRRQDRREAARNNSHEDG